MKGKVIVWSVVAVLVVLLLAVLLAFPSVFPLSFGTSYRYSNADRYQAGGAEIRDEVSELKIDWVSGSVRFLPHGEQTVRLEESSSAELTEKEKLHWYYENGKLTVREYASGRFSFRMPQKDLTVFYPAGAELKELEIRNVSGSVRLEKGADVLKVETVSGDIRFSSLPVRELDIETVSGNVTGELESLSRLDFESVSGDLSLALEGAPEKIETETVSGDVSLRFAEGIGFSLEFESASGKFDCAVAFDSAGKNRYRSLDGSPAVSIEAESVSGDFRIG